MKVEILDCTTDPLFVISMAARTCYNSREKDDINKRDTFVKGLIKSGHETPLEFASVTFDISGISRVCQNQIVRHRIASYCVLSERYVDVSSMDCLMPVKALQADDSCIDFVRKSKEFYKKLVLADVPKEDARMFLPQGMMTNMCMHMNFRALRNFLKLRLDKHAQWEVRQIAREIYMICSEKWSWLVEDIVCDTTVQTAGEQML